MGVCLEGAVCHRELAQGGSHHLAIDGHPSPVVKQAPMGPPEHWGHCVPPSQETYHPMCCYPHRHPPTASPMLCSPHISTFSTAAVSTVNRKLEDAGERVKSFERQYGGLMTEWKDGGKEGLSSKWRRLSRRREENTFEGAVVKGAFPHGFRNMEG